MTTIAYKDGVIAYDSQLTQGNVIKSQFTEKQVARDGVLFFIAGPPCDYDLLVASWFAGKSVAEEGIVPETGAYVVDQDKAVWECAFSEEGLFWKNRLMHPDVIGSGAHFALAAMDMGASARKAVEIAMARDIYTGGVIREYDLRDTSCN